MSAARRDPAAPTGTVVEGAGDRGLESLDDHGLIRRAREGEEAAFAELVRRHQGRALRVARQMVPDRDDAQDLAQEAFLRVFRSLDRFDFKHEFTTWLYRIVSNLAIDHLRKRRPVASGGGGDDEQQHFGFDLVDTDAPPPSRALESEETVAAVRRCIAALPPHFGAVLALRELEGLPCTEIARIVDATHVTVRWRLHRARKLFLEEWERQSRRSTMDRLDGDGPDEGERESKRERDRR